MAKVPVLKSETGMPINKSSGFTLIEILVVLVILGITASVALLAFGDFGESRRVEAEAKRFLQKTRLIRHHALLEATTYGMKIMPTSYEIFRFTPPNTWTPATSTLLKPYTFPQKTLLYLNIQSTGKKNWVVFQASGEITPFILIFGVSKKQPIARVYTNPDNIIAFEKISI